MTIGRFLCALVVFCAGSLRLSSLCAVAYGVGLASDAIDGRIARMTHTTTPFGRAMDSAADKSLVAAAMLLLTANHRLSGWLVLLFVIREFAVFGLRSIHTTTGAAIAQIADRLGRVRFFILHAGVAVMLLPVTTRWIVTSGIAAIAVATFLSYLTLLYYVVRDWAALSATLTKVRS
jgi:CDP-diacylglycerol--glycerol-3-phosphate 3-phosphatidyltransferase